MSNLKQLLEVKNLSSGEKALYFYGDIVSSWWGAWSYEDKYPEVIKQFLEKLTDETLHIYINSPGGSVFAGMAIFNMLSRYKGKKIVHIDGIAASISSVIAMTGDKIVIPENAMMMIHRASCRVEGNAEELARCTELLEKIDEAILGVYEARLRNKEDLEKVKELVEKETYLSAKEVSELFKDVEITQPLEMVAKAKDAEAIYNASVENEKLRLLDLKVRR